MVDDSTEVTALLRRWSDGDRNALDQLIPRVYSELRKIASERMRHENAGHLLESAALVNEAFLKLVDQQGIQWQNRAHFFAIAAQAIRRILVDHARTKNRAKRGGAVQTVVLDERLIVFETKGLEILALDDALTALEKLAPEQSRVVELRFFAGLTAEETAETMGISRSTVNRDWVTAKAWLIRELKRGDATRADVTA